MTTEEARLNYSNALDLKIDEIRARYPAAGKFIVDEYRLTGDQAQAFATSNYQGDVPPCVASWSTASGMTPQQAADDILATKALYELMLEGTREARLVGKAQINQAPNRASARAIFEQIVATLEASLPAPA